VGLHVGDEAIVAEVCLEGNIELLLHELIPVQQGSQSILSKLGSPSGSGIKISPQFFESVPYGISVVQDIAHHQ